MKTIFINVILNSFQDLTLKKMRCRNKFGMTRGTRGFTLIELLVAMGIIGILASLLLSNFIGVRQRARDGVRKSDLRQIQASLELYRSDQASYPNEFYALVGGSYPCGGSFTGGSPAVTYMRKTPCDPLTGLAYTYLPGSGGVSYSIIACLENTNDSQIDPANANPPCSSANWSYTLQNP